MFQNTKNTSKILENLETEHKTEKNQSDMVKLVLQHKQIDNVKSSNVKEFTTFSKKYDFSAFSFDAAYDYHNNVNFIFIVILIVFL